MPLTKETEIRIPILSPPIKVETYEEFASRLKYEYSVITANISCKLQRKRLLTKSDCKINKVIRILTSTEDKSSEISFVLKTFNLWKNEEFWKEVRLEEIMRFYARNYCHYDIRDDQRGGGQNEAIIKNLFSILIFDWNKPIQHHDNFYFLKFKFDKFASTSSLNLFQILYDILNRRHLAGYHHICLLIIYHYLYEVSKFEGEWSEDFNITKLGSINDVLIMHNSEYQIEILKILVVHWNVDYWRIHEEVGDGYHLTSHRQKKMEYDSYKQSIMYLFNGHKPDNYSIYTKTFYSVHECNKQFFRLAFLLKEMTPKKFESEFEKYVKFYRDTHGEYWKVAIKSDVHLLLRIADGLELFKTVEFMFKKCPFIALNWNILMNFEDYGEFRAILNRPLKKKEMIKMNFIEKEFQKIEDVFGRYSESEVPPPDVYIPSFPPSTNINRDKFLSINSFGSDDSFKSTRHTNDLDLEMRSFETVSDVFFETESVHRNRNQQMITSMKVKILKRCFRNWFQDRKIFFGRKTANHLSLFEQILKSAAGSSFVNYVWSEFRLWEIPEILTMINPLGITLLHYAIESKDDLNLITFLLPQIKHRVEFKRHKHYMKALNNLYFSITEKTILDFYLEVSMDDHSGDHEDYQGTLCRHIIHLLEEIGTVQKLSRDPIIDKLIHLAEDELFYEKIVRRESKLKVMLIGDRRKEKFHIDDLLGRIIVYWKPNGDEKIKGNFYPAYKRRLTNISPFFELLFNIIEHRSKNFKSGFRSKIHKLEHTFDRRYNDIVNSEYHTSSLTFILLLAAIQTNEKGIIKFIFDQDIFETIKFEFPSNMKVGEIHYFTALMLLKNGYELGKLAIPEEWITPAVLYDFLDSQVRYFNQALIEIDCSCMLHSETRKTVVKTALDVTEKMLLWDDDRTLQYIISHKNISSVIVHPVIAHFIELKYKKYQSIYRANFWIFVLLFVLPFSLFIFFNNEEVPWQLYALCIFSIFLFIAKEIIQYKLARSPHMYLKDLTNKIDIPLLLLSILLLVSFMWSWSPEIQSLLEVIFIFVMIWDAMTMLPIEAVGRTLLIIKRVLRTFVKVFLSFALIIFAFAISFKILFGSDELDRVYKQSDDNGTTSSSYEVPEREPNMRNFEGISTTFVKVLVMMAGEYTIEPSKLKWYQLVLFGVFVVFSFLIFNLLLGMSIEDIQNLREDSIQHDLERKARKIVDTNQKFEEIYAERLFVIPTKPRTISLTNRIIYKLSKLFLSEFIFLHSFRKIYINIKTREVTINVNGKQEKILKRYYNFRNYNYNLLSRKYFITKESLDKIHDIISVRDQENCLNVIRRHS